MRCVRTLHVYDNRSSNRAASIYAHLPSEPLSISHPQPHPLHHHHHFSDDDEEEDDDAFDDDDDDDDDTTHICPL